jgi:hypothetical protein
MPSAQNAIDAYHVPLFRQGGLPIVHEHCVCAAAEPWAVLWWAVLHSGLLQWDSSKNKGYVYHR